MADPIIVADRSPTDLQGDLTSLGVRCEVAQEVSSYLIESVRLKRPALVGQYIQWRQSYELERGGDSLALLHEIELLSSTAIDIPDDTKDAVRECLTAERLEQVAVCYDHAYDSLANEYLAILLTGNRRAAHKLIADELDNGLSIENLYLDVFQLVLYKVGDRWQRNQLSVGQEHFCTAVIQATMAQLYPRIFSSQRNGHQLVATSVSGNLHEIGIRMVADLLELNGWDTHYLGVDCPAQDIVDAIAENEASMLAVSATMVSQLSELQQLISAVRSEFDPEFPILVGGKLFNSVPDLWKRVSASAFASDARAAVQVASNIAGV